MSPAPSRAETLERYKLAFAEYRAEVALGNERQKLFVTLNPAIAALSSSARPTLALLALTLAALASLAGIALVWRSHGRYQRTRGPLLAIARELGFEHDWQTTGGMREARGEPRFEGVRVVTILTVVLALYVAFDAFAIGWLLAAADGT